MKNRARVLLGVLLAAHAIAAIGQGNDRCVELMKYAQDRYYSTGNYFNVSSYARTFCQREFESEREYRDYAGSVGVNIEAMPIGIQSQYKDGSFKEKHNRLCEEIKKGEETKLTWHTDIVKANADVVRAIERCVAGEGPYVRVFATPNDSSAVEIDVSYTPYPKTDLAYAPLTAIAAAATPSNAAKQCAQSCAKALLNVRIDRAKRSCQCTLTSDKNSDVTFTFFKGSKRESRTVSLYQRLFVAPPAKEAYIRAGGVSIVSGHPYRFGYEVTAQMTARDKKLIKEGVIQSPRNSVPSVVRVNVPAGAKTFQASFQYVAQALCEASPNAAGHGIAAIVGREAEPKSGTQLERRGVTYGAWSDIKVDVPQGLKELYLRAQVDDGKNDWCGDVIWNEARFAF